MPIIVKITLEQFPELHWKWHLASKIVLKVTFDIKCTNIAVVRKHHNLYRLFTEANEGSFFTNICLFTGGGSAPLARQTPPQEGRPPSPSRKQTPLQEGRSPFRKVDPPPGRHTPQEGRPPPSRIRSICRWHASYWNILLILWILFKPCSHREEEKWCRLDTNI